MKAILILDASTEISAAVFRVGELSDGLGLYTLARAGFGRDEETQGVYVALIDWSLDEIHTDPFKWRDETRRAAHRWLVEHFDEIPHGGSIDAEPLRLAMAGSL